MSKGIPIDSVVVQGDILPVINYLQYKGRIKKPAVVAILEQCQHLLARAPCLFRLVYLPRECNRLADYFAGQASAAARKADNNPLVPLHHVASLFNREMQCKPLPSFSQSALLLLPRKCIHYSEGAHTTNGLQWTTLPWQYRPLIASM